MEIGAVAASGNPERSIEYRGSWNPDRSIEYRQRAAECRALAYEVCNEGSRKELLALADVWMTLAEARRALPQ